MNRYIDLDELLDKAAEGTDEARENFYFALLDASVFLPVRGDDTAVSAAQITIGTNSLAALGVILANHDGKEVVPVFSSADHLKSWLESEDAKFETLPFVTLLKLVNDSQWLHLNPGQDVGKLFSPWEIQQLRGGPEAIAELAKEIGEGDDGAASIARPNDEEFAGFYRALRVICEAYEEVNEAFVVQVGLSEGTCLRVLCGLSVRDEDSIPARKRERLSMLTEEIREALEQELGSGAEITFITDLGNELNPNWEIFSGVTPIYYRPSGWR